MLNNINDEIIVQKSPATTTVVNLGVSFLHLKETEKTENPNGMVERLKLWGEKNGIGAGQIMMTTRTILVGGLSGIDLQKIASFIGLDSVCRRAEIFAKKHI